MKEDDFYYPSALGWMWNYCHPLGKFTDSEGNNYDLGVFIDMLGKQVVYYNATVYGDTPGDYFSGEIYPSNVFVNEVSVEVLRRAKEKGIIPNK
jgi:hypothetical protein